MCLFSAPHSRSRIYTDFNSYWSFFRDLILGRFNKGNEVEKFERALADKFEVSNAICLPMARVAIYFTLKHLLKPGQEIILSPYTVADVINMVICAKAVPVFADLEQTSCNIDPDKIEPLINEKTGAIMITHLHGIGTPTYKALEICRKHNLPLIEDASQAFGGYEDGKRFGTIGDIGIYSIGMYKNINSWYGGAIVSENRDLIDRIRLDINQYPYQSPLFIFKRMLKGLMTDLLTNPIIFKPLTYWIFRYGFLHDIRWINKKVEIELDLKLKDKVPENYLVRYTPFQARLALPQLKNIDLNTENRVEKAILYHEGLKDIPELIMPPLKKDGSYTYPVFPVQYRDRKKLLKWLMSHKRDVAAQHLKNCADLPSFSAFYRDCPVARKTANEVIILPTYPRYPISEVQKNIRVIRAYFER
jgi:perosamine synthetase